MSYNWNIERTAKETAKYAEGVDNPLDAVTHTAAAGVHVVTGVGDAILGDIIRLVQGEENRVPLAEYSGNAARLKLDGAEAVQSVKNVFKGKLASVLTLPVIAFKAVGDGIADGADALAGVRHGGNYSTAA